MSENSRFFKKGLVDGIPIGLGYFGVSFAFGISAVAGIAGEANGLSVLQATLISLTNLTSAGQVGGLSVIFGNGTYFEMALIQLIINLRYCLMSFALSQKFDQKTSILHRMVVAFGITDEIFAVSVSQKGMLNPFYSYGAMILAIPGWTIGTFLGALCGSILPEFIVSALGVAIYGMFIAVIVPPSKKNKVVLGVVIAAMIVSSIFKFVPFLSSVSSGFVIIISTVLVAGLAAAFFPHEEEEENA